MPSHLPPDGWIESLKQRTGTQILWDIVVEHASVRDWERALEAVRAAAAGDADVRVTEDMDVPLDLVFRERQIDRRLMVVIGEGEAHAHFFSPGEIEFDIDPRPLTTRSESALLTLMRVLATSTGLPCKLTPENLHHRPLMAYDPGSDTFSLHDAAQADE